MRTMAALPAVWLAFAAGMACVEASSEGEGSGDHGEHGRIVSYNVHNAHHPILFMFLCLLVGAVLQLILVRLPPHWPKPPYTVLLFIVGYILGAMTYESDLEKLGHATRGMVNMDPHLVLYVFLPPLLFESAFSMTSHVFSRCFPQALLLAGPGVLIATGLTGVLCRFIFSHYDWGWTLAFMFGAMVSATDPVAVVGLLVELNAAKPLSTVIEAESLMNDGSAFVVFLLLLDFAAGNPATVGEVIETTCRMAIGGPLLGLLFGIGFHNLLHRFCINDAIVEISLTVTAAYLAFWTAESVDLKASGVLTVVTLGAYMGGPGASSISPEIHHHLHHVWAFLGHMANTVIFVLSGAFTYNLTSNEYIQARDWGYLALLYIIVHITRGATIVMLWWGLKNTGYGVSVPRGIIMWYGGLRGAVGLVLALLVSHEEGISVANRARIQFLVAGLVALTIGVNGTTAGLLYKHLGLAEVTKGHRATVKLSVDYVESNADALALSLDHLEFWGRVVRDDIKKEYDEMAKRRPHRIFQGKHDWSDFHELEKVKRKVGKWFDVQPVWMGRKLLSISHVTPVQGDRLEFDVEFCHIFNPSEKWPPPVHTTLKYKYFPTTERRRFTIDTLEETGKVIAVGVTPHDVHDRVENEAKEKRMFDWYPDFTRILSKDQVGWIAQTLNAEQFGKEQVTRPLLGDIREDLRRILIVSVRHRYEQWSEERIISPDVFNILEEALLFVEDEDRLYNLEIEYDRVLESLGLCEDGPLALALTGLKLKSSSNEPFDEKPDESEADEDEPHISEYWQSRTDFSGRTLGSVVNCFGGFATGFVERFTYAYLHRALRQAVHALMFYKAAHVSAFADIQKLWGALLDGDMELGERRYMQDEEEILRDNYQHAEELMCSMAKTVPDIEGIIASIHEDFIHNLMVAQMKESVGKCLSHGLLTDGDSSSMKAVIQRKLRPFFKNPFVGSAADRLRELVELVESKGKHEDDQRLPDFLEIEHLMHEQQKRPIMSKKTFWEIKFISRLQGMASRTKMQLQPAIEPEEEEESIAFVTIDGVGARSRASGGSALGRADVSGSHNLDDEGSPFALGDDRELSKKYAHLSSSRFSGGLSDEIDVGDPVVLKPNALEERRRKKVGENDNLADGCPYDQELSPTLLQTLMVAKRVAQLSRKGWVRAERFAENGQRELLVHCSLVPEELAWTWYPAYQLRCMPAFFFEEVNEKSNAKAKGRLQNAVRRIWLRAAVDRTRQVLNYKFPYMVEVHWMKKKEATHHFVGTKWPWWGYVTENEDIIYTDVKVVTEDGEELDEPDWGKGSQGVLLKKRVVCLEGPGEYRALVRDKHTMAVKMIPEGWWKEPEVEIIESHYSHTTGLLPSSALVSFVVGNTEYSTTEHYYQACKFSDIEDQHREARLEYRRQIIEARTAERAHVLGHDKNRQGPPMVPNWEAKRDEVMIIGLRAKFSLNHGIREHHRQLMDTEERVLMSSDKEELLGHHWGVHQTPDGQFTGHNMYGKMLMLIRDELRHEIVAEPLVAAALAVLVTASPIMGKEFRVGERVKVKAKSKDKWNIGTVQSVRADRTPMVLAVGETEAHPYTYVQACTQIQMFCPECGAFIRGNAGEESGCSQCSAEVSFPELTRISTHAGEVRKLIDLSPGAAILPPRAAADGLVYPSVDHFYQAHKFTHNPTHRELILKAPTADKTVALGSDRDGPPILPGWDAVVPAADLAEVPEEYRKVCEALGETMQLRIKVMIDALRYKYDVGTQVLPRHETLNATGNTYLMYDDREDTLAGLFWGVGPLMTGLNVFGHLNMAAREVLRKELRVLEGVLCLVAVAAGAACVAVAGDRPFERVQYSAWARHLGSRTPNYSHIQTPLLKMIAASHETSPATSFSLEPTPSQVALQNVVAAAVAMGKSPPSVPADNPAVPPAAKPKSPETKPQPVDPSAPDASS